MGIMSGVSCGTRSRKDSGSRDPSYMQKSHVNMSYLPSSLDPKSHMVVRFRTQQGPIPRATDPQNNSDGTCAENLSSENHGRPPNPVSIH